MRRALSPGVTILADLWRQIFSILRTDPLNFVDLRFPLFKDLRPLPGGFFEENPEDDCTPAHRFRETSSFDEMFLVNHARRIAVKYSESVDPDICKRLLMLDLSWQWLPMRNIQQQAEALRGTRKPTTLKTKDAARSKAERADNAQKARSVNTLYSLAIIIDGITLGTASLTVLTRQPQTSATSFAKKAPRVRTGRKAAGILSAQAQSMLRLIVDYIRTATMMELRGKELAHLRRRTQIGSQQDVRLRTVRVQPVETETTMLRRLPQTKTHGEGLILIILDEIHRHYDQPLSLKYFARKLKLNAAYVCALFTRCVGTSFKRYLTDVRINQAKSLLAEPTCRIAEISSQVGYRDGNRFRAAFKKETGLPPSDWRQTWQLRKET